MQFSPDNVAAIAVALIMAMGGIIAGLAAFAGRKTAAERRAANQLAQAQADNLEAQSTNVYQQLVETSFKQRLALEELLKVKDSEVVNCAKELALMTAKHDRLERQLLKLNKVPITKERKE